MLISADRIVFSLLAIAGLSLLPASADAGAYNIRGSSSSGASRSQSPDPAYTSPAYTPVSSQTAYESGAPGWCFRTSPCFNCGVYDRHVRYTRFWRDRCGSTYYPRVAPYCVANWGWTQPCWRRAPDNYTCVRPDYRGSTPKPRVRRAPVAAPVQEPPSIPEPPPLPTSSRPQPAMRTASQTASYARPPAVQSTAPIVERRPDPSRFTSIAETVEPEMEDDEANDGDFEDTLEAQTEAAGESPDDEADESDAQMIDE